MASTAKVAKLKSRKISCDTCGVKQDCFGADLYASKLSLLGEIKGPPHLFRLGEHLFRAGDPFRSLYVIQAGTVKTYTISEDGDEQIIGLYGPSEMIGFDAIVDGRHQCNAAALDISSVCKVSFEAVLKLCERSPKLLRELITEISRETLRLANMLLLARKQADQRVASLLLSEFGHQHERGYSARALIPPSVTRTDMGKYLGLSLETVCRVLTRFEAQGLVIKDRKQIRLHDLKALRRIAADPMSNVPTVPVRRAALV